MFHVYVSMSTKEWTNTKDDKYKDKYGIRGHDLQNAGTETIFSINTHKYTRFSRKYLVILSCACFNFLMFLRYLLGQESSCIMLHSKPRVLNQGWVSIPENMGQCLETSVIVTTQGGVVVSYYHLTGSSQGSHERWCTGPTTKNSLVQNVSSALLQANKAIILWNRSPKFKDVFMVKKTNIKF